MKYRASWKNTSGFKYIIIIMGIFTIAIGIITQELFLILIGITFFIYLLLIGLRLYVEIKSDRLIYQGWLKKHEVKFDQIKSITCNFSWPRNQYYGPFIYEINTKNKNFLINLLYFDSEFNKYFHRKFNIK